MRIHKKLFVLITLFALSTIQCLADDYKYSTLKVKSIDNRKVAFEHNGKQHNLTYKKIYDLAIQEQDSSLKLDYLNLLTHSAQYKKYALPEIEKVTKQIQLNVASDYNNELLPYKIIDDPALNFYLLWLIFIGLFIFAIIAFVLSYSIFAIQFSQIILLLRRTSSELSYCGVDDFKKNDSLLRIGVLNIKFSKEGLEIGGQIIPIENLRIYKQNISSGKASVVIFLSILAICTITIFALIQTSLLTIPLVLLAISASLQASNKLKFFRKSLVFSSINIGGDFKISTNEINKLTVINFDKLYKAIWLDYVGTSKYDYDSVVKIFGLIKAYNEDLQYDIDYVCKHLTDGFRCGELSIDTVTLIRQKYNDISFVDIKKLDSLFYTLISIDYRRCISSLSKLDKSKYVDINLILNGISNSEMAADYSEIILDLVSNGNIDKSILDNLTLKYPQFYAKYLYHLKDLLKNEIINKTIVNNIGLNPNQIPKLMYYFSNSTLECIFSNSSYLKNLNLFDMLLNFHENSYLKYKLENFISSINNREIFEKINNLEFIFSNSNNALKLEYIRLMCALLKNSLNANMDHAVYMERVLTHFYDDLDVLNLLLSDQKYLDYFSLNKIRLIKDRVLALKQLSATENVSKELDDTKELAMQARQEADRAKRSADEAKRDAREATRDAIQAENVARQAKWDADQAKNDANQAKWDADQAKWEARNAKNW